MGEDVDAAAGCLGRSGMSVATPSKVQVCREPEQMSLEMFFTLMFMAVSAATVAAEVVCWHSEWHPHQEDASQIGVCSESEHKFTWAQEGYVQSNPITELRKDEYSAF